MIWLTWRQLRLQTSIGYLAVAALVVVLALTGGEVAHLYHLDASNFLTEIALRSAQQTAYFIGCATVLLLPALIGAFWGAPLISRELETGTYRLAWTQTVSRTRWLATKLGIAGLAAVALGATLSLGMTWWSQPVDKAVNRGFADEQQGSVFTLPRLFPLMFDMRGVAPIGYAAFAFALGVSAGLVVRRAIPAMALTLAIFAAVQVAVPLWVRPNLVAPVQDKIRITTENLHGFRGTGPNGPVEQLVIEASKPGGWELANATISPTGSKLAQLPSWVTDCLPRPGAGPGVTEAKAAPGSKSGIDACLARLDREGYRQLITYHPSNHYWPLQWREMSLYLAAALLLVGFCFWRVRRIS
jgi:hypothetical protein